jgi:hypothetical protein
VSNRSHDSQNKGSSTIDLRQNMLMAAHISAKERIPVIKTLRSQRIILL